MQHLSHATPAFISSSRQSYGTVICRATKSPSPPAANGATSRNGREDHALASNRRESSAIPVPVRRVRRLISIVSPVLVAPVLSESCDLSCGRTIALGRIYVQDIFLISAIVVPCTSGFSAGSNGNQCMHGTRSRDLAPRVNSENAGGFASDSVFSCRGDSGIDLSSREDLSHRPARLEPGGIRRLGRHSTLAKRGPEQAWATLKFTNRKRGLWSHGIDFHAGQHC